MQIYLLTYNKYLFKKTSTNNPKEIFVHVYVHNVQNVVSLFDFYNQ
jgi:hypothetical protein